MVIDGHAHACGELFSSHSIEEYLNKYNIDKVVICGGEPNSKRNYRYPMLSNIFKGQKLGYFFNQIITRVTKLGNSSSHINEQNEFVWKLANELPERIINAYWVNPLESNCKEKMEEFYSSRSFKLLKLHQCWTNFEIDGATCKHIFEWATIHNIPVFIHLSSHQQVQKFVDVANNFSATIFIVAHMIGSDYMATALTNKNVYFDLSAPQLYSAEILKRAIENHGIDRLIMGSDTPYGIHNFQLINKRLEKLSLSHSQRSLVLGENLFQLLNFTTK